MFFVMVTIVFEILTRIQIALVKQNGALLEYHLKEAEIAERMALNIELYLSISALELQAGLMTATTTKFYPLLKRLSNPKYKECYASSHNRSLPYCPSLIKACSLALNVSSGETSLLPC